MNSKIPGVDYSRQVRQFKTSVGQIIDKDAIVLRQIGAKTLADVYGQAVLVPEELMASMSKNGCIVFAASKNQLNEPNVVLLGGTDIRVAPVSSGMTPKLLTPRQEADGHERNEFISTENSLSGSKIIACAYDSQYQGPGSPFTSPEKPFKQLSNLAGESVKEAEGGLTPKQKYRDKLRKTPELRLKKIKALSDSHQLLEDDRSGTNENPESPIRL